MIKMRGTDKPMNRIREGRPSPGQRRLSCGRLSLDSSLSPTPKLDLRTRTGEPGAGDSQLLLAGLKAGGAAGNRLCLARPPSRPISGPLSAQPPAQPPPTHPHPHAAAFLMTQGCVVLVAADHYAWGRARPAGKEEP